MKVFFSILLLLTTALYILPLKEIFNGNHDICHVDMDESKEESNKKEKSKELFSFSKVYTITKDSYSSTHQCPSFSVRVLMHTVETPPPDLA